MTHMFTAGSAQHPPLIRIGIACQYECIQVGCRRVRRTAAREGRGPRGVVDVVQVQAHGLPNDPGERIKRADPCRSIDCRINRQALSVCACAVFAVGWPSGTTQDDRLSPVTACNHCRSPAPSARLHDMGLITCWRCYALPTTPSALARARRAHFPTASTRPRVPGVTPMSDHVRLR
jgi:hypothetical protein